MTKHRRIEITAFRRRIRAVSGQRTGDTDGLEVRVSDADSLEPIEAGSGEEQEILIEAIRLLEERISCTAGI